MSPVFAALPDHRQRIAPNYLYALQFKDGRVKIGVTWNPRARAKKLEKQFCAELVRAVAVEFHGQHRHRAEAEALRRACGMAPLVAGHVELFTGLQFGDAETLLRQIARRNFNAPPVPFSRTKEGRKAAAQAKQQRADALSRSAFAQVMRALTSTQEVA